MSKWILTMAMALAAAGMMSCTPAEESATDDAAPATEETAPAEDAAAEDAGA